MPRGAKDQTSEQISHGKPGFSGPNLQAGSEPIVGDQSVAVFVS
jgi:hypothetical protein